MGRILAIDYGQKRIGIAVTDPMKIISSGLATRKPHEIFDFLETYFAANDVECVVLGYPKQMNNLDSESFQYVKQFETAFRRKFPEKKLVYEDERFSSLLASRALYESGMKKKERQKKENLDKMSAAIILQSYLERIQND
jgi:putative Holliday junction resolvase